MTTAVAASIVGKLRQLVGADGVLSAESDLLVYECDGFVIEKNSPDVVVFPNTTEQVAQIVKLCAAAEIPFLPRGAGTSLAGGCLPGKFPALFTRDILAHIPRCLDSAHGQKARRAHEKHREMAVFLYVFVAAKYNLMFGAELLANLLQRFGNGRRAHKLFGQNLDAQRVFAQ